MDEYILELQKEEFLNLLSVFITNQKGKKAVVKANEDVSTTYSPYGDTHNLKTEIYYEESIEVFGYMAIKKTMLPKEEILEMLNLELSDKDYQVTKLDYVEKIKQVGDVREYENIPVFYGVKISVKPKQKVHVYKKEG